MALAVGSGSVPTPAAPRSAEAEYNKGLQAKTANHFPKAAADFRRAVDARANFPEAWNELDFALRQTDQLSEALKAYEHALRLRPEFPEALEYPGKAHVKMGCLEDARAILVRLNSLDPARARELEVAMQNAK
jgi:tetratricopeptide (TPR) repeat protein